mmetsp:Transcript_17450/g.40275  ORF Transcript_17450/g.40275 Transcript_17450/m.40275 type:complete len:306 (+) Transcript_17450:63-980(+)|eukprot:CAMPEP_0114153924 /NCGR_PEP_ID=MMETSP0043_2-20121206/24624_1 /TAXON_ID=464988 /ORGANISM="Hemiselmis andersenii, Strain CCMP644" /LENGTH=305 /DNA_ID=CAMNT_0001249011 /DNA_START=71 /DNA_END=988 /DNA_ORIENTATION=-
MATCTDVQVKRVSNPPRRLEGGGFEIRDIMSGFSTQDLDPFLMWHELPRKYNRPGEFPGAPMHPHRGFCELPYAKEMSGGNTDQYGRMIGRDHKGNTVEMGSGDFEFGTVAGGIEHEAMSNPQWEGYMHFFQLWINLPASQKFGQPSFQNAKSAALPVVTLAQSPQVTAKILVGTLEGKTSPCQSAHVPMEYIDFEAKPNVEYSHEPPKELARKLAFVYRGSGVVAGKECSEGQFVQFTDGDRIVVSSGSEGLGMLFIAAKPLGEPVVQYGPFVMNTQEQIKQCFSDYQRGELCKGPCSRVKYEA